MNLSNHPPSGNMTPKGSSSSSFTTSSTVPPLLSQSSVSNIPFSTTANAPYSAYLTGNAMNSSSHGSAHGSVGGGSVSGSVAGGGAGGGSVRSQGSIPMMGFKQDSNDASRYDDPMRAQGEGMRRGWNDDETGTETESEMDYGPTNGAAGNTHSHSHSLTHSSILFLLPFLRLLSFLLLLLFLAFSLHLHYYVLSYLLFFFLSIFLFLIPSFILCSVINFLCSPLSHSLPVIEYPVFKTYHSPPLKCNVMRYSAGSRLERMGSTMTASMNQTMSNISSQMISPEQLEEANKLAKVRTYGHTHMCAVIEYCDVVVIGIAVGMCVGAGADFTSLSPVLYSLIHSFPSFFAAFLSSMLHSLIHFLLPPSLTPFPLLALIICHFSRSVSNKPSWPASKAGKRRRKPAGLFYRPRVCVCMCVCVCVCVSVSFSYNTILSVFLVLLFFFNLPSPLLSHPLFTFYTSIFSIFLPLISLLSLIHPFTPHLLHTLSTLTP